MTRTGTQDAIIALTANWVGTSTTTADIGYSPDGEVRTYIDAGLRFGPEPTPRTEDLASVGIAHAQAEQGDQTMVEATYEWQLRYFTVQPTAQLLLTRERNVGVLALRSTIAF